MTNNQDKDLQRESGAAAGTESEGFEPTNRGQNLGGGKGDERTIDVGEKADDNDDFSKTDQSIAQAAPGQTATNTNQGGSNA